jgi:hypothetical protein
LGEDAEPEAVMESLDMVDQMLAGEALTGDQSDSRHRRQIRLIECNAK